MLDLDIIDQRQSHLIGIPSEADIKLWIKQALIAGLAADSHYLSEAEISLSLVEIDEIQSLNNNYRGKDKPTNVLSFPTDFPEDLNIPLLGDIIISTEVVEQEAKAQGKSFNSHFAHMCIHSCLHLLGFDHIIEEEAEIMEGIERKIMLDLGFDDPY